VIELHITDTGIIKTVYSTRGDVTSSITYPSEDNLPEPIRAKVSALKLMQDHDDIPDVGQKVSDKLFWIYEGELSGVIMGMMMYAKFRAQPLCDVPKDVIPFLEERVANEYKKRNSKNKRLY